MCTRHQEGGDLLGGRGPKSFKSALLSHHFEIPITYPSYQYGRGDSCLTLFGKIYLYWALNVGLGAMLLLKSHTCLTKLPDATLLLVLIVVIPALPCLRTNDQALSPFLLGQFLLAYWRY